MDPKQDPFKGPDKTVLHVTGRDHVITLDDARAMKDALLDELKRSKIEDKDYLVRMTTKVPAWIDPDGHVRIGGWLLQARGQALVLAYRLPQGPGVIRGYVAQLKQEPPGWKVLEILPERIAPRRK